MNRFMISMAAVGLMFAMGSVAQAKGPGKGPGGSKGSFVKSPSTSKSLSPSYTKSFKASHHDHDKGHFFKGDYHCYRGKSCNFWNYHCWDSRYGCYLYWNPWYRCYYYWCEPDDCYYPITYVPYHKFVFVTVTPVIYTTPVTVVAQPVAVAATEVVKPVGPAAPAPVPAP